MPPFATPQHPYDSICCRFVHASTNKNRAPVNVVHWFPNGTRLISGTQTGEITIWNGFQFHFENILQAHNAAVRAMQWTPEETVLVSGDQLGIIKFWDQHLLNFETLQAHKESICDITICPTGMKFCSCADDSHAKVWDLRTGEEERAFTGHGWDVKCCDWHPTKGLVATGSKDSQIKLWDPRASEAITTIFCHKNTVTRVCWSPNGQWLASGSRDQLVMLMDIRTMSVRKVFKAHQKEVTSLCWHPESDALLASGGYDAAIHFWDTYGPAHPIESIPGAHEGPVWSLSWNPLGHLLVSGSHDYSTRFWSRARPGDTSWTDLLPKKIGLGANEPSLPPAPAAADMDTIFNAGIFAEPSPPPPPPKPKLEGVATSTTLAVKDGSAAAGGPIVAKAAGASIMGLTVGEGANQKTVLDTSDFDAEDGDAHQASTGPGTKSGTSAQGKESQPDAKTDSAPTKPNGDAERKAAPATPTVEAKAVPAKSPQTAPPTTEATAAPAKSPQTATPTAEAKSAPAKSPQTATPTAEAKAVPAKSPQTAPPTTEAKDAPAKSPQTASPTAEAKAAPAQSPQPAAPCAEPAEQAAELSGKRPCLETKTADVSTDVVHQETSAGDGSPAAKRTRLEQTTPQP